MKLNEHQLDEADLTFHDLAVVEEKFVGVLSGMHHQRVEYPTVSLQPPQPNDSEDSLPSVG
jgi:membrane-associated HD superfamily phosphohydrolase